MKYYIGINQKAIAELNKNLVNPLDLKDATILDWMVKFHAEPKSKKIMIDDDLFFWGAYALIVRENPLLFIEDKYAIAQRVEKLIGAGLVVKHLSKDKGNRTYFSITQKCFDLVVRGSDTLTYEDRQGNLLKQGRLTYDDRYNNNIIDNIYTTTKEKINSNRELKEVIHMQHGKAVNIDAKIEEFARWCQATNNKHQNDKDIFTHFANWMKWNADKKPIKDVELLKKQSKWYVDTFNAISNRNFVYTSKIEESFIKMKSSGDIDGDMIIQAIKNLRSSDDRNWHKSNRFVHATPEYLLKEGNLNKYANLKF